MKRVGNISHHLFTNKPVKRLDEIQSNIDGPKNYKNHPVIHVRFSHFDSMRFQCVRSHMNVWHLHRVEMLLYQFEIYWWQAALTVLFLPEKCPEIFLLSYQVHAMRIAVAIERIRRFTQENQYAIVDKNSTIITSNRIIC